MPQWLATLIGIVFSGTVLAAILGYVMERRSKKAKGIVATKTVDLEIESVAIGNEAAKLKVIEDRIELIDEAARQERESWVRTIGNLRGDLTAALVQLRTVEQELYEANKRHRIAIGYVRVLIAYVNYRLPGDIDDLPPLPDGLDLNA